MKVDDRTATLSREINEWASRIPREDRPRISAAEVPLLIHYARELKSGDSLVEIGTGWAGSTAIFSKVCDVGVSITTIDNGSNFRRFGPKDNITYDDFIRRRLLTIYGIPERRMEKQMTWILADSTRVPWSTPIDLLFIDGAHTYEGVKGDIENMIPHVRGNGVVIFHDYHMKGVKQAVDEFLEESGMVIENRARAAIAVRMQGEATSKAELQIN